MGFFNESTPINRKTLSNKGFHFCRVLGKYAGLLHLPKVLTVDTKEGTLIVDVVLIMYENGTLDVVNGLSIDYSTSGKILEIGCVLKQYKCDCIEDMDLVISLWQRDHYNIEEFNSIIGWDYLK